MNTKVYRVIAVALTCLLSFQVRHSEPLKATVTIHGNADGGIISRHLYGHFAEHLGQYICDGHLGWQRVVDSQYAGHT
jgi:alpha-L-arabinofuranosidase